MPRPVQALVRVLAEMERGFTQAFCDIERAIYWLWNAIKELPGVRRVGNAIATWTGLAALDRALTRREHAQALTLAMRLESSSDPVIARSGHRLRKAVEQGNIRAADA